MTGAVVVVAGLVYMLSRRQIRSSAAISAGARRLHCRGQ